MGGGLAGWTPELQPLTFLIGAAHVCRTDHTAGWSPAGERAASVTGAQRVADGGQCVSGTSLLLCLHVATQHTSVTVAPRGDTGACDPAETHGQGRPTPHVGAVTKPGPHLLLGGLAGGQAVSRPGAGGHCRAPGPGQPHATASSPRQGSHVAPGAPAMGATGRARSGRGGFCGDFPDSGDRPGPGWQLSGFLRESPGPTAGLHGELPMGKVAVQRLGPAGRRAGLGCQALRKEADLVSGS